MYVPSFRCPVMTSHTLCTQFVSPVFSRPPPAQKALEQFYPEISHPQPPISVFPPHQLNLEHAPFTENPRPQSKPDTLHYTTEGAKI